MEKITKDTFLILSAVVRFVIGLLFIYVAFDPQKFNKVENGNLFFAPAYLITLVLGLCAYFIWLSISKKKFRWVVFGGAMVFYVTVFSFKSESPLEGSFYMMTDFRFFICAFGVLVLASSLYAINPKGKDGSNKKVKGPRRPWSSARPLTSTLGHKFNPIILTIMQPRLTKRGVELDKESYEFLEMIMLMVYKKDGAFKGPSMCDVMANGKLENADPLIGGVRAAADLYADLGYAESAEAARDLADMIAKSRGASGAAYFF